MNEKEFMGKRFHCQILVGAHDDAFAVQINDEDWIKSDDHELILCEIRKKIEALCKTDHNTCPQCEQELPHE